MIRTPLTKQENRKGLVRQIAVLVVICIIITGAATYSTEYYLAKKRVTSEMEDKATHAAGEVISSLREYPAYRWLIVYCSEHIDDMEIEYDEGFKGSTISKEKEELLLQRHPDFNLHYCNSDDVESLPEEDQKLFAEIVYSRLITRLDNIKAVFGCDYLSCILIDTDDGDHPYETALFLLSAASPDSVRGSEYGQVYILGVTKSYADDESARGIMRGAVETVRDPSDKVRVVSERLDHAGNYVDYYSCPEVIDDKALLVDVTYSLKGVLANIRRSARNYTEIAIFFQIVLVMLIMRRINRYMLIPLKEILQIIRSYTETKDSEKVEADLKKLFSSVKTNAIKQNEIGQLAEDFVELTREIDDYAIQIEKVAASKKLMEYELTTAASIQAHMLPDPNPVYPDHPEFELCASMTPAREVGGDFYDYFLIDDDHLVLVMADVSDKGVPAALFMAEAKTLIKSRAETGEEPGEILYYVNNRLCETNEAGYFVTVWLAVINVRTGEGIAANAGHEHPVLCRAGGDYELVIYKHSLAIGMMEDVPYRQHTFKLNPGDRLFVYTDGVPEANNIDEEQFGETRMLEALNSKKDASPRELLTAVSEAIDDFVGEASRFDDTTMMCLSYKGESIQEK